MHKLLRLVNWRRVGRGSIPSTPSGMLGTADPWMVYIPTAEIAYARPAPPPTIEPEVEDIIAGFQQQCSRHASEFDRAQCLSCTHFASIFLPERTHPGTDEYVEIRGPTQNQFNNLARTASVISTPIASSSAVSTLSNARSKTRIRHEWEDHSRHQSERTEDGSLRLQLPAQECLGWKVEAPRSSRAEEHEHYRRDAEERRVRPIAEAAWWRCDSEQREEHRPQEEAEHDRRCREEQVTTEGHWQNSLQEQATEILERVVDGCIVTFSAGLAVQHVVTGFECGKVFFCNLPLDVHEEEVIGLLSQYGFDPQHLHITNRDDFGSEWALSLIVKADTATQIRSRVDELELRGKPLDIRFGVLNDVGGGGGDEGHQMLHADYVPDSGSTRHFICNICFNAPTAPRNLLCGHKYCTGCLQHMFASVSGGTSFPLRCLGDEAKCSFHIPIALIREFVSPTVFEQLLTLAFSAHAARHPDAFRPCATPNCNQLYRPHARIRRLRCPSCTKVICASCGGKWHAGMSCEEASLANNKSEQERLTEEYFRSQRVDKRCPACNMPISKTEGCNHMTCRCGVHFCWWCLKVTTADAIYAHMQEVHGDIYEQVPPLLPPPPVYPPANYDPLNDQALQPPPFIHHVPDLPVGWLEDAENPFLGVDYREQQELLRQAAWNREQAARRANPYNHPANQYFHAVYNPYE